MKTKLFLIATIILISTSSCKKKGCTDPKATNYSQEAKKDDNSCIYPAVSSSSTTDKCEGYTSSLQIQTPNHGALFMNLGTNTYFRVTSNGQTEINAQWFDTPQKKYEVFISLPTNLIKGVQNFNSGNFTNGVIDYKDETDSLNNYTYLLLDSLQINVTEMVDDANSDFFKPIEATFSGKYKYWGYTSTGQVDTSIVNLTGAFNLCGIIE